MILKGKKVILRPVRLSDAPRFVKWLNDPEVHKFLQTRRHLTLAFEKKWLRGALTSNANKIFAIQTLDNVHIGSTSLEINRDHDRATFGIFIGDKRYWNKGLGSEAARLIIDYGFTKLKLHRIELGVLEYNPRAIKVYRRLGFKREGIKHDFIKFRGKYFDDYHMAILDREWKKRS
ncbi:MAG: GNAT family N-acetyltransferase [Patescibacteria group bacterium]|nr:GNAT family N-acetyltransferase [Patescibacteria group bacterium]